MGDLVSQVDVNAERAIIDLLRDRAPSDLILSEETMQTTKPEAGRRIWIVDPLDGTACFVFHTQPELVSVLIALYDCDLKRVTHGVELFPLGDAPKAVYARLGKGAFVNGVALRVRSHSTTTHAVFAPHCTQAWPPTLRLHTHSTTHAWRGIRE